MRSFRRFAIVASISFALAGCGYAQQREALARHTAYIEANKPLAESGKIKWSSYYDGLYESAKLNGAPGYILFNIATVQQASAAMEAGKISQEEFASIKNRVKATQDEQTRMAQENQQQQALAGLAAAAQILNASGPQTLSPPFPASNQPIPAMPMGTLKSNTTSGTLRYCSYSNGVVTTIPVVSLCALTNN